MALSAACVTLAELLRGCSNNLCGFTVTGDLQLVDNKVNEPFVVQATEIAVALPFKDLVVCHSVTYEISSSCSTGGWADAVVAGNKH